MLQIGFRKLFLRISCNLWMVQIGSRDCRNWPPKRKPLTAFGSVTLEFRVKYQRIWNCQKNSCSSCIAFKEDKIVREIVCQTDCWIVIRRREEVKTDKVWSDWLADSMLSCTLQAWKQWEKVLSCPCIITTTILSARLTCWMPWHAMDVRRYLELECFQNSSFWLLFFRELQCLF